MNIVRNTLFENIESHLRSRGVDPNSKGVFVDPETEDVHFLLYNLSGQLVGYQKYNPNLPKEGGLKDKGRYYSYVSKGYGNQHMIAVWGLQSYDMHADFLFVTEGIFDAVKVHNAGYPAIAVLGNDPAPVKSWLRTLNQIVVVVSDNDAAGRRLNKFGDFHFSVEGGKDLGDLSQEDANQFIEEIIQKITR